MGLAAEDSFGGSDAIPFFAAEREKFLEYDLAKLITGLDSSAKAKVALLTGLPMAFGPGGQQAMMSGQSQPYMLYQQMQEQVDLHMLEPGFEALPGDMDLLMLVHPPALADDQLFQIEQYMLKGGRALIFVDPHSEGANPQAYAPSLSDLGPLLAQWGVTFDAGKIIGDAGNAQKVRMNAYGPDAIRDYIF